MHGHSRTRTRGVRQTLFVDRVTRFGGWAGRESTTADVPPSTLASDRIDHMLNISQVDNTHPVPRNKTRKKVLSFDAARASLARDARD